METKESRKVYYDVMVSFFAISGFIFGFIALFMILSPERFTNGVNDVYTIGANENPRISQPLAFEEELLSSPCKPSVGCLYPIPNPINIKSGKRDSEIPSGVKVETCKLAWRDCPAFADCVRGQCKPKKNIYDGI